LQKCIEPLPQLNRKWTSSRAPLRTNQRAQLFNFLVAHATDDASPTLDLHDGRPRGDTFRQLEEAYKVRAVSGAEKRLAPSSHRAQSSIPQQARATRASSCSCAPGVLGETLGHSVLLY
ncbi:MAG: hypothetical protein B6A08_20535, partial [Sorangiineae bacterium NIC37A_2]